MGLERMRVCMPAYGMSWTALDARDGLRGRGASRIHPPPPSLGLWAGLREPCIKPALGHPLVSCVPCARGGARREGRREGGRGDDSGRETNEKCDLEVAAATRHDRGRPRTQGVPHPQPHTPTLARVRSSFCANAVRFVRLKIRIHPFVPTTSSPMAVESAGDVDLNALLTSSLVITFDPLKGVLGQLLQAARDAAGRLDALEQRRSVRPLKPRVRGPVPRDARALHAPPARHTRQLHPSTRPARSDPPTLLACRSADARADGAEGADRRLEDRLLRLERALGLDGADGADGIPGGLSLPSLAERLAALEGRMTAAEGAAGAAGRDGDDGAASNAALAARLAALEAQGRDATGAREPGADSAALAAAAERAGKLDADLESLRGQVDALSRKVDSTAAAAQEAAPASDLAKTNTRIGRLEEDLASLRRELAEGTGVAPPTTPSTATASAAELDALAERVRILEEAVRRLTSELADAASAARDALMKANILFEKGGSGDSERKTSDAGDDDTELRRRVRELGKAVNQQAEYVLLRPANEERRGLRGEYDVSPHRPLPLLLAPFFLLFPPPLLLLLLLAQRRQARRHRARARHRPGRFTASGASRIASASAHPRKRGRADALDGRGPGERGRRRLERRTGFAGTGGPRRECAADGRARTRR